MPGGYPQHSEGTPFRSGSRRKQKEETQGGKAVKGLRKEKKNKEG